MTVTVNAPRGVEPLVVIRSVELPGGTTGLREKLADVLAGNPPTVSATLPLNPFTAGTETVYDAVCFRTTETEAGLIDSPKSRGATTRVTVAEWIVAPLVPVMVSGYEPAGALQQRNEPLPRWRPSP